MRRKLNMLLPMFLLAFLSIGVNAQRSPRPNGTTVAVQVPESTSGNQTDPAMRGTCCPPINPKAIAQNLFYETSTGGSASAPFTLKFHPTASFNNQMQQYINLVNVLNLSLNEIMIDWRLHDQGTGPLPMTLSTSPGNNGPLIDTGGSKWVAFSSVMPAALWGTSNFFGPSTNPYPMVINHWYMVHTGTYMKEKFFPDECANNDVFYNFQAPLAKGGSVKPVLQILNSKGQRIQ